MKVPFESPNLQIERMAKEIERLKEDNVSIHMRLSTMETHIREEPEVRCPENMKTDSVYMYPECQECVKQNNALRGKIRKLEYSDMMLRELHKKALKQINELVLHDNKN